MANIARRPNGKYRARYRDEAGREHARHFTRKADAQRWLDQQTAALATGSHVAPRAGKTTLGVVAGEWLTGQVQLKPSTRARYEGLLRLHVLPAFGARPVSSISAASVEDWVARLSAAGLSGSSVRHAHRVLSLVLGRAVKDRMISTNPAEGVENLPRAAKGAKRFLTADEVALLAHEAGPTGGIVVLMLAYTGLRFGELAALRVRRVDLLRRRLDVAESVTEVGGEAVYGTPKTHQARTVPLPRFLVDDIARLAAGPRPDDLLFTAPEGGVLRLGNFRRRVFDPAARRAGVGHLTLHDLRHTAASLAIASGANVKDVQAMLGHASAAMTLDTYAGLFDDSLDAVADRMDALSRQAADRLRTAGQIRTLDSGVSAGQTRWGGWGLNPRPTDYESAALTG